MKKKVCKRDKLFVDGEECPICHGGQFSTNWQGRMSIINPEKSEVAKRAGIKQRGDYAIKCR